MIGILHSICTVKIYEYILSVRDGEHVSETARNEPGWRSVHFCVGNLFSQCE